MLIAIKSSFPVASAKMATIQLFTKINANIATWKSTDIAKEF